ncbi:hypothetical protein [Actinospica sp.]|uniref:hypothetical protein n=1 Tax=Actinospica sp. TaxID=1872142 RepID=UPI002BF369A9|nr:hypothetical protein [Actinospica sp.]HWG24330.1 hypothetical protein [Actinospica sp.]
MQKSEEERSGQPADRAAREAGYQALADAERWASLGAGAPRFADRVAAADSAAAAHGRLVAGVRPQGPDGRLDEAEARVRPEDWWEALARAYHWQLLTALAYGVQLDPEPQQWAADRLAEAAADPVLADRLELVRRRLAGEALVLRHALGTR